jgi:hypothetical protein
MNQQKTYSNAWDRLGKDQCWEMNNKDLWNTSKKQDEYKEGVVRGLFVCSTKQPRSDGSKKGARDPGDSGSWFVNLV